jgi:hypothetical protein
VYFPYYRPEESKAEVAVPSPILLTGAKKRTFFSHTIDWGDALQVREYGY